MQKKLTNLETFVEFHKHEIPRWELLSMTQIALSKQVFHLSTVKLKNKKAKKAKSNQG